VAEHQTLRSRWRGALCHLGNLRFSIISLERRFLRFWASSGQLQRNLQLYCEKGFIGSSHRNNSRRNLRSLHILPSLGKMSRFASLLRNQQKTRTMRSYKKCHCQSLPGRKQPLIQKFSTITDTLEQLSFQVGFQKLLLRTSASNHIAEAFQQRDTPSPLVFPQGEHCRR
jgi:hypothetical protein